jgi:plasmid stabilization system protein ParE
MKVIVREGADEDLDGIFAWINEDSPIAAMLVIRRIRHSIARLAAFGMSKIGRAGRDAGTRKLIEGPYIIVYEIHEEQGLIEVLAILSAQER